MENHTRSVRKSTKEKLKKGVNGSISILLCVLITPFLSIALGLVEYARYQQVIELTEELFELVGVSELTDYDSYLHDRFGVLATSQENNLKDGEDAYIEENKSILANQVTINNFKVSGKLPLSNAEVLERQIVDVSELSSTTAVIVEDLNLDVLLDKLSNLTDFQNVMDTMDSLADVTDALNEAVTAIENLKSAIETLISNLNTAIANANTLATKLSDLINKLGENGIQLPANASAEEIQAALEAFDSSYISDLKDVYNQAKNLKSSFDTIKTQIDVVKTNVDTVVTSVGKAQEAMNSINTSNSIDSNGSISKEAVRTLDDVLKDMTGLVENTLSDIKQTTLDSAKQTLDDIVNTTLETTGLSALSRYNSSYFSLPLSDSAKEDIVDLLKVAKDMYSTRTGDSLKDFLASRFIPDLNFRNLKNAVTDVITSAENALVKKVTEKISKTLKDLVKVAKGLFDLDVFFDSDLNAFVDIADVEDSGYQEFLEAVGKMLTAAEDFSSSGLNIFKALKAMKDMFTSIFDLMDAVMSIAGDMISGLLDLAGSAVRGDVRDLYENMLISGYMVHNLPCRTNYAQGLSGEGLTGFDYSKIPTVDGSQSSAGGTFQELAGLIDSLQAGKGKDKMFVGAELEYIRAGTNSELANQIFCFFDIYFLRLVLGLPGVFMDTEVTTLAASTTIAAWIVYIIYIILEPFCDTVLLVNGASVPIVKTDCWLSGSKISDFLGKLADVTMSDELKNTVEGFVNDNAGTSDSSTREMSASFDPTDLLEVDYPSHMLIILMAFVTDELQIERLSDIMELEAKKYYTDKGGSFKMNKTYSAVQVSADVTFNAFFDLGLGLMEKEMKQTVSY